MFFRKQSVTDCRLKFSNTGLFIFRIELEPFEVVTSVKHVNLNSEGTLSGFKGYIAVGTTMCFTEDIASKGRVRLNFVFRKDSRLQ